MNRILEERPRFALLRRVFSKFFFFTAERRRVSIVRSLLFFL
jgi:hypothetical protein